MMIMLRRIMTRTRTRAVCHIDDSVTRRGSLFSDPPKPDSAAEDEEDVRKRREWIVH